jgi:hypothetical protein
MRCDLPNEDQGLDLARQTAVLSGLFDSRQRRPSIRYHEFPLFAADSCEAGRQLSPRKVRCQPGSLRPHRDRGRGQRGIGQYAAPGGIPDAPCRPHDARGQGERPHPAPRDARAGGSEMVQLPRRWAPRPSTLALLRFMQGTWTSRPLLYSAATIRKRWSLRAPLSDRSSSVRARPKVILRALS